MSPERKVRIHEREAHNIHTIRDQVDEEMRRMEDELSKFRGSPIGYHHEIDYRAPSMKSRESSNFVSPSISESSNGKTMKLKFDVADYEPEEIVVKTVDNKLQVYAKHEEKSDSRSVFREYSQEFLLPEGTDPDQIKSSLSRNGVLTIEAPVPKDKCKQQALNNKH